MTSGLQESEAPFLAGSLKRGPVPVPTDEVSTENLLFATSNGVHFLLSWP